MAHLFKIGDRVRVISDHQDPRSIGREGVVNAINIGMYRGPDSGCIGVTIDGLKPAAEEEDGFIYEWGEDQWSFYEYQLEPIQRVAQRWRDWVLGIRIRRAENRAIKCGTTANWLKVSVLKVKRHQLARMAKGQG